MWSIDKSHHHFIRARVCVLLGQMWPNIQQTWMRCVAFSPDGALIASYDSDGIVWLWDAQTGERLATFSLGDRVVENALFSPDGRLVAALGLNTKGAEISGLASGATGVREPESACLSAQQSLHPRALQHQHLFPLDR